MSPGGEIIVFGHNNKIITFSCMYACNLFNRYATVKINFYLTVKWCPSPTNDICQMFQTVWSDAISQAEYVLE